MGASMLNVHAGNINDGGLFDDLEDNLFYKATKVAEGQ